LADQAVTFRDRRGRGNQERNELSSLSDFNGFAPLDLIKVTARVLTKLPDSDAVHGRIVA
jgi:hypothetical protein